MAMTVAEQIKQRGWEEGKKEGKKETAANMLKLGIDMKTIIQATGLTEKEIKRLTVH